MKNKAIIFAFCIIASAIFSSFAAAQSRTNARKQQTRKIQSVRITLTETGYRPSSFRLKKGIPARVTFVRKTADECGEEIVIPAYNIRRILPVGKAVLVRFTPTKTGTFDFACGMDMLHGKLIVQ
jgi:plastocyanin domain-containing protein